MAIIGVRLDGYEANSTRTAFGHIDHSVHSSLTQFQILWSPIYYTQMRLLSLFTVMQASFLGIPIGR